jgi:hypothetical protein
MARIRVSAARSICTKSELLLLTASRPDAIGALSVGDLRRKAASARRLRDKWSELSTRQLRETQRRQMSRVTDDNARTEEKAGLFGEALARFETRLAKVLAQARAAGVGRQVRDNGSEAADRARSNHEKRSVSRGRLSQARGEFNAARSAAKSSPKKEPATRATHARSPKAATGTKKAGRPPGKTEPLLADRQQQREAREAAKRAQGRESGLLTRARGHVLASGRRAQKKRDSR